jgi:hypothetical protein
LVANLKSQVLCETLIYSLRQSGCSLPVRLIHFGGEKITSEYILSQVEFLTIDDFSPEAKSFITNLRKVLTACPLGFLYRFLAFFSDWDEFIYSDNDVIALTDWEKLFDFMPGYDLVHADEEYTTSGRFNYKDPGAVNEIFGDQALTTAVTGGHFAIHLRPGLIEDMNKAAEWFLKHPDIPKMHDQALLHITALIGQWRMLNLCKTPYNWLSTWAGDYKNPLELIHAIQATPTHNIISHLHYSGRTPRGDLPIEDLLFSNFSSRDRLIKYIRIGLEELLLLNFIKRQQKRISRFLKLKIAG